MIAWMLYTVLVGLCVVLAALAADWLTRLWRRPVRSVWIGAAALCMVLPATARLRARAIAPAVARSVDLSSLGLVQSSMQTVERHMTASAVWYALGAWALATLLVATVFGTVYVRLRRMRALWPEVEVAGHRVLVSPAFGPIVVGFIHPQVIVPWWVLHRSAAEQRLIIEHEFAHVRARDPILLGIVSVFVAFMPWNPALWVILSRIRLAVEIDCDARVLRGGASAPSYGSLLVDVAERTSALRFAALTLTDRSSHLQQRILAMQSRRISHPIARGAAVALVGAAALLAACEAKMPTAADIDHMDAASAERNARQLALTGDTVVWSIDGKTASVAEAKAIPADSVVDVSVKTPVGGARHINVLTVRGRMIALATTHTDSGRGAASGEPVFVRRKLGADSSLIVKGAVSSSEQPLLLIDGVRSDLATLKTMDRSRIASVEILKGVAAQQVYGDAAKNGVIVVTTKPSQSR